MVHKTSLRQLTCPSSAVCSVPAEQITKFVCLLAVACPSNMLEHFRDRSAQLSTLTHWDSSSQ